MEATENRSRRRTTPSPAVLLRTEPGAAVPALVCEQCGDPVAVVLLTDGRWRVMHLDAVRDDERRRLVA